MTDREALAAALERVDDVFRTSTGVIVNKESPIFAAARRQLALTPEPCRTCKDESEARKYLCPSCRGRGTVYPPALVDRGVEALAARDLYDHLVDVPAQSQENYRRDVITVLDALNDWKPECARERLAQLDGDVLVPEREGEG